MKYYINYSLSGEMSSNIDIYPKLIPSNSDTIYEVVSPSKIIYMSLAHARYILKHFLSLDLSSKKRIAKIYPKI